MSNPPISCRCDKCGHKMMVPHRYLGQKQSCRKCGEPFMVKPLATKQCPYCAEEIKAEAIVCRFCNRELEKTPLAPVRAEQATGKPAATQGLGLNQKLSTKQIIGGLLFALVLVFVFALFDTRLAEEIFPSRSGSNQPSRSASKTEVRIEGDQGVIDGGFDGPVYAAYDLATFKGLSTAAAKKDRAGFDRLPKLALPRGTHVLILETKIWDNAAKVRVLDGPYVNETLWVTYEWIR